MPRFPVSARRSSRKSSAARRARKNAPLPAATGPHCSIMMAVSDLTLDELRPVLAPDIARAAIFDGWSEKAVDAAAEKAGVAPSVAHLAFGEGAMQMIGAWVASVDGAMESKFSIEALSLLPIRERIRTLVLFRLEAVAGL